MLCTCMLYIIWYLSHHVELWFILFTFTCTTDEENLHILQPNEKKLRVVLLIMCDFQRNRFQHRKQYVCFVPFFRTVVSVFHVVRNLFSCFFFSFLQVDENGHPFCKCTIGHCIESNGFTHGKFNPKSKMNTRTTLLTFNYGHVILMVIDGVRVSLKWQVYHIFYGQWQIRLLWHKIQWQG